MKEKLKLIYISFCRLFGKLFFLLPIKNNRIIFESFAGDGYNCNPKYVYLYLNGQYPNKYECIWALRDPAKAPSGVKVCKYRSFKHFLYRITSRVYVCNFLQAVEIPKRRGQIEIQTWHGGGCYKTVGNEERNKTSVYDLRTKMQLKETDYFIASSLYFENEVIRKQFCYKGIILECGMPRNDVFFNNYESVRKTTRKNLGLQDIDIFVLYAPTWRKGEKEYEALDFENLEITVKSKYGSKCVTAYRGHIYGNKIEHNNVLNLSNYPDMQELLCAADILITDYSSSMWDYSFTYKPCFLFVPDIDDYLEARGLDRDIDTWGFPVSKSNDELCWNILNFDESKYRFNMDKHHSDLGSFENGKAANIVSSLINEVCNYDKKSIS